MRASRTTRCTPSSQSPTAGSASTTAPRRFSGDSRRRDDLSLLLAFGKLAFSRERWSEARGWFERALRVAPTNSTIKLNLGMIAMAEENLAKARGLLEEAVAGNPALLRGLEHPRDRSSRDSGTRRVPSRPGSGLARSIPASQLLFNLGLAYAQAGRLTGDRLSRGLCCPRRTGTAARAGGRHGAAAASSQTYVATVEQEYGLGKAIEDGPRLPRARVVGIGADRRLQMGLRPLGIAERTGVEGPELEVGAAVAGFRANTSCGSPPPRHSGRFCEGGFRD